MGLKKLFKLLLFVAFLTTGILLMYIEYGLYGKQMKVNLDKGREFVL